MLSWENNENDYLGLKQLPFDYLKVIEFDPDQLDVKNNWSKSYALNCVIRSSVHIQYSQNSNYTITFDVFNDGSAGFKAIRANSLIAAANNRFVIQSVTKKFSGAATATVTATQVVNAWLQRYQQNTPLFSSIPDASNNDNTDSDNSGSTNDSSQIVVVNLDALLHWFQTDLDLQIGNTDMTFSYHQIGYFPARPVKNLKNVDGKQLLTTIEQMWPGTLIIPIGFQIYFVGYQKDRDANGNLVNALQHDTGIRFDAMANASDVEVTTDSSRMLNAIEVKSATHPRVVDDGYSNNSDDGDDQANEFTTENIPYFKNFLATSDESIKKYGLYASSSPLDDGFTNWKAALAAAREKMVLEPQVSVKATIDHPGRTEFCPTAGDIYHIGTSNEGKVYHVEVKGYDWYPFNSSKGCQMTLDNIDPGIIDNLKTTIIHDAELSPTVSAFKMITDNDDDSDVSDDGSDDPDSANYIESPDTSNDTLPGMTDSTLPHTDSDNSQDRPDDVQRPTSQNLPKFKAHLPIYSVGTQAGVTYKGNIIVNKNNKQWMVRQAISDDDMNALKSGQVKPEDLAKNHMMDRIFMIDFNHGKWLHGKNINLNSSYQNSNFYFGHTTLFGSGLIATQANQFTFRANVPNSDYQSDGTMRHEVAYYNDDGTGIFVDTRSGVNPGHMARVNTGPLYSTSRHDLSRLSTKHDVKKLDESKATNRIMNTDIGEYRYDKEYDSEQNYEASVIIDDVNDKPKWRTPDEFKDASGGYRNDSSLLAYTVVVVKSLVRKVSNVFNKVKLLTKRINKLEAENQQLKQEIEDIKKQLNN